MYYFLDSQKALLIVEKAFLKESNEIDNKGRNAINWCFKHLERKNKLDF